MSTNQPYSRVIELFIGPLTEELGGGPANQALRILADGSRDRLRIKFDIKKTLLSSPNASVVEIYNLKRDTVDRIRRSFTKIRMNVGWENTDLNQILSGGVMSYFTDKQTTERVTKVQVLDGVGGIVKGVTNKAFSGRLNVGDIVRDIAGDLPGVSIGNIDVDGTIGSGGLTVSDRSAEALDRLAAQYGFSWSVQDGTFQAVQDTRSFANTVIISGNNRNLIKATPILAGPMQIENGVEITAILDPSVRPGSRVRLESAENPNLNGTYKVHEVDFSGDSGDRTFTMTIRSFKVFAGG